jgi:pilus assembly protein CpaE
MATATVATAEQPAAEQREQFLAFVADPETSSVIDQVVGEMMLPHAAIREGGVKEAVKYLSEQRSPRLLLVDLSGSDLPLSEINSLADVCEPGVTVLALGDRNDCGLFRDLLQHGVADYLVKPVTPALLQKAIQGASDQSGMARTSSSKLGKLVAVSGTRGGVGATTLATSIAWLIANERRRRVALVDLDLQFGTVALSLDLEPSHGLREALENPNRIDGLFMDRVLVSHSERLFVLSAEESPDEPLLLDYNAVELLLTELRNKFHYVVVDLPRSPNPCTQQVMQSATDLVLVTDLSLAGMRDTMRIVGLMPTTNASCAISLVANRAGEHKQGEMPRAEFEKGIGRKLDLILPFDAKTVAAATNFGQPVAATKGPVANGLHDIADRLCGPAAGTGGPRAGFLQKLLKKS